MQFHFFCPKHNIIIIQSQSTCIDNISSLHFWDTVSRSRCPEWVTDIVESESHNHLPGLACVSRGRLLATDCDLCFLAPVPALWAGMWVDPAQAALLVISWHRDSNGPAITHHTSHQHTAAVLYFYLLGTTPISKKTLDNYNFHNSVAIHVYFFCQLLSKSQLTCVKIHSIYLNGLG